MVYYLYIFVPITTFLLTLLLTPLAMRAGKKRGYLSTAEDPEIKRPPVTDTGGLAVIFSILAVLSLALFVVPSFFHGYKSSLFGILVGTVMIALLGFIDDRRQLSAGVKFAVQIAVSLLVMAFGVKIAKITNPAGYPFELGYLSIPVTILWIVGITNAVNMTDGMDGLAPGVLTIGSLALFIISAFIGFPFLAVVMLAIFGSTLAFLHFNYPPAKIILGNAGAYSLGFIVATATIVQPIKASTFVVFFVPLLALGLPVLEMLITVFRRLARKKKIYIRDTEHLHHVLLALGLPPQVVNWIFYCLSFLFATVAVGIAVGQGVLLIAFVFLLLLAFIVLSFKLHTHTNKKEAD
ncbi:MAG: MraY family glycosyltransferase [bacterium]